MRMSSRSRAYGPRILASFLVAMVVGGLALIGAGARPAHAVDCTYSLSSGTYSVNEGEAAQIVVNQVGSCAEAPSLTPGPLSSALAGIDFVGFTFIGVTFPDGDGTPNSRTISISTIENVASDGNRTFNIVLNPPGAPSGSTVLGNASAVITIVDDDGSATFSYGAASYSVNENGGSVQVTVLRSGATGATSSVDCTVTGGSAILTTDYTVIDGQANFAPLDTTSTCTFGVVNDGVNVGNVTMVLGFANPVNFPGGVGGIGSTTITIVEDDGPGTIQFGAPTFNVSEGAGTANVTVTRTGGSAGAATVLCNTLFAGSAVDGLDYSGFTNQLVSFLSGETSKSCVVPISNDFTPEAQEWLTVQLSNVVGASLGGLTNATLYIDDDDGSGNIAFTASSYSGPENTGPITIYVARTGGSGSGTVNYSATSGGSPSAVAGIDFTPTSGTLTWGSSDFTTKTFTVSPIDDFFTDGPKNVLLTLSAPTGGLSLGSPSTANLVILDNETTGPVIISISPASGSVLGGTVVTILGLNLSGATSVSFGGASCVISSVTSTQIVCTTTAHTSGLVEVIVTTPTGQNTTAGSQNDFLYTGGPTITSLSPATGAASGNTVVTITGTNFTSSGMIVRFDATQAVFTYINSTTVTALSPPHSAGTINVTVTTSAGTSPDTIYDDYTYTGVALPVVTGVSPGSGPIGTTVTVTGSGFTGATQVTFGGVAGTFTVNNDGQITASVPAGTPSGTVDVRVTTATGTSANTASDNFTNTSAGSTVTYTLYFRFTLIVWTGPNGMSALAALRGQETPDNPATNNVSLLVGAVWRFDASTQTFKGYFPGSDGVPGANDFTTLQNGTGYFIALLNAGTVTWTAAGAN